MKKPRTAKKTESRGSGKSPGPKKIQGSGKLLSHGKIQGMGKSTHPGKYSRYATRFAELRRKGEGAFMPFVMLGDPDVKTSFEIVKTLIENGADVLELGLPFSDPIADGKTIQAADQRALAKHFRTADAFRIIAKIRKLDNEIPIGLLVYSNLINSRGIDRFYMEAGNAGVDGILAADVPIEEAKPFMDAGRNSGVQQIFLVAPTTTPARMRKISKKAKGFIYAVSLLGVTGARKKLSNDVSGLVRGAKKFTSLPVCVGFGISKPEHVRQVLDAGADGAIVGSAIVSIVSSNAGNRKRMLGKIAQFSRSLKNATVQA